MTIELRASVRKAQGGAWFAHARAFDTAATFSIIAGRSSDICYSHPEAMQAAYKLLADLDRALMDEVHASRASRRIERCGACRDLSNVHRYTPDCTATRPANIHTTEATS